MNARTRKLPELLILSLVLAVVLVGCQRGGGQIHTGMPGGASGGGSGGTETTIAREELPGDMDVESMLFSPATGLQALYFDYNRFDLRQDALDTLRINAEKIKAAPGVVIQIEGHCDERGTQEYNLALGEKRALATRSHLINLGVSGDRLITISYGEEDPADSGHSESAWAKNRGC
ncbi:MAG: OmpA family protein, partial [Candidatus Hydrogenedentes bacterium]|nr:OmpA family protein [Candidatus Hydrogenedentota bacterium]